MSKELGKLLVEHLLSRWMFTLSESFFQRNFVNKEVIISPEFICNKNGNENRHWDIKVYIYPWNVQTYDFTFCSIMIMRVFPLRLHNFCVCSFFFIIKTNQYTFYINFSQLFNISFSPYPLGTMHAKSMQRSYLHSIIQDCLIIWFWEDIIAKPGAFLSWLGGVGQCRHLSR